MKMVMNQLLGTVMAAFSEGLVLGESLGLSREVLFQEILSGAAGAPFLAVKRERIESGDYQQADFPLRWLQKDLHLASVSAYETGVALPLTNIAKEIYRLAMRDGHGGEDFSAVYEHLAQNRDVPLADRPSDALSPLAVSSRTTSPTRLPAHSHTP